MKLNSEQMVVCNVFSLRDKTGHVHCYDLSKWCSQEGRRSKWDSTSMSQ